MAKMRHRRSKSAYRGLRRWKRKQSMNNLADAIIAGIESFGRFPLVIADMFARSAKELLAKQVLKPILKRKDWEYG